MYAGDHEVYVTGTSIATAQVQSQFQFAGNQITKWYEQNLLQVNGKKYQAMLQNIEGKENGTSIDSLCGNEIVGHSDKLKLLGVTIDNQLNFSENISQLCQKASQQVGVLMRIKKLVPERAKLVIYRSSILPHLTYRQKIWHFARASDKRKLERIQEKALWIVFLDKTSTYEQLFFYKYYFYKYFFVPSIYFLHF